MAYVERTDEEIIAAWERAVERSSRPDARLMPVLAEEEADGVRFVTPREFIHGLKTGDESLRFLFVELMREGAKASNEDIVAVIDSMDFDSEWLDDDEDIISHEENRDGDDGGEVE